MLQPDVVDRIHALSRRGFGRKRIARELGISRNSVRRDLLPEPRSAFKNGPRRVSSTQPHFVRFATSSIPLPKATPLLFNKSFTRRGIVG